MTYIYPRRTPAEDLQMRASSPPKHFEWPDVRIVDVFTICLSIGTALAGIFGFFSGESSQKINAAIDLSIKYASAHVDELNFADRMSVGEENNPSPLINDFANLQYIAYLSEKGKLNDAYISDLIKCSINVLVDNEKYFGGVAVVSSAAKEFARKHPVTCPRRDQGSN